MGLVQKFESGQNVSVLSSFWKKGKQKAEPRLTENSSSRQVAQLIDRSYRSVTGKQVAGTGILVDMIEGMCVKPCPDIFPFPPYRRLIMSSMSVAAWDSVGDFLDKRSSSSIFLMS